jgi:hypothetical protein
MTFLRSHLNEEGYILFRWLRLKWSRRRRERALRGRTHVVMPKLSKAASERLVKSLENNTAAFTPDPPPPQPCKSCLAVFKEYVYTHGDCGVKPADYYAWAVPEVKHVERTMSSEELLEWLGNASATGHDQSANLRRVDVSDTAHRARIQDFNRLIAPRRK